MDSKSSSGLTRGDFQFFARWIQDEAGIRLDESKRLMVAGRLTRRMRQLGMESFKAYRQLIESGDGQEVAVLINCLTTNKTEFFREPRHFEFLREEVRRRSGRQGLVRSPSGLRIWSAGCSTGEEIYSIAMTLAAVLDEARLRQCALFASDIDTDVLSHARRAIYSADKVALIPPDTLRLAFLRGYGRRQGEFQVKEFLQRLIRFQRINLMDPQWDAPTDLNYLFCRNVMIYFDRPTQIDLVRRFRRLLVPGGFLVVGHSESLFGFHEGLESIGSSIYRRTEDSA